MALAPMADVTDAAFRRVIAKYGKPDVMFTEFVSADGLMSAGRKRLLKDLWYNESERPIVAQIFGANPENIRGAAELIASLGFDGIDINMGCPERNIQKQGSCAALIKKPKLAQKIILAAKAGAGILPVSIKTRIGYNKNEIETWLPALLETEPAVITIHARTKKEMSDVPAQWDAVKRAVEIRNERKSKTLVLGNGDVKDLADAKKKAEETGVDGVMLGRAIFGNPWLFGNNPLRPSASKGHLSLAGEEAIPEVLASPPARGEVGKARRGVEIDFQDKLRVCLEHTLLFEELFSGVKNFAIMKKHYKAYIEGFPGAKELRVKMMEAENASGVEGIIHTFLSALPVCAGK